MSTSKNVEEILRALLDTELVPEKEVPMRRFGIDFRVRAIDGKRINKIRQEATYPVKGGSTRLDEEKFGALIIVNGCAVPDWTDAALTAKFGPTPTDTVQKRLLAGEIAKLSAEILEISGFQDEAEALDEVKN